MNVLPRVAILSAVFFVAILLVGGRVDGFSPQRNSAGDARASPPSSSPSSSSHRSRTTRRHGLPELPSSDNPYTLLGLDSLSPTRDFGEINRAYKARCKVFHPDIVAGPDSSAEERAAACETFARLNAAYEDLKARQDEEEFEMVMMGGNFGAGEGRSGHRRVKYKTSDKIRESTPNRVNYNRIVELRERKNLKATHWKDEEYQFNRHNGDFGPPRRW